MSVDTNLVFLRIDEAFAELCEYLAIRGIIFPVKRNINNEFRLVTHLDVSRSDIELVLSEVKAFYFARKSSCCSREGN